MDIEIIAHPNASFSRVETDMLGQIHIYVHEPPLEGKANRAISKALAKHLKIKPSQLMLLKGETSKHKHFRIISQKVL